MRRCETVVVGLAAIAATAVLGTGHEHARAAQARATLQVTVQVVAPCAASLGATGRLAVDAACATKGTPFTVVSEGAAPRTTPDSPSAASPMLAAPEIAADTRYITLLY